MFCRTIGKPPEMVKQKAGRQAEHKTFAEMPHFWYYNMLSLGQAPQACKQDKKNRAHTSQFRVTPQYKKL